MTNESTPIPHREYIDYEDKFGSLIIILALLIYISTRIFLFNYLPNSASSSSISSIIHHLLFGSEPFSIINVILGFDLNEGLFGLIQPKNLLLVIVQGCYFFLSYSFVRLPFIALTKILNRKYI